MTVPAAFVNAFCTIAQMWRKHIFLFLPLDLPAAGWYTFCINSE
jgi:hypothetical protein